MKRIFRTGSVGMVLLAVGVALAPSAAWAISVKVSDIVNAQTTLATLSQTVTIPAGTFVGRVNASTSKVTGTLKLPPATTTVTLAGIGLATATFTIVPTGPVVGKFNFNNYRLNATSVFNIHVDSVTPQGLAVNLAGNDCFTSTPVSLAFSGKVSPFGGGTVRGSYTIPNFANCEAITAALNLLLAGPGNTFTAAMTPKY
jgi:hypothetical protein